MPFTAARPWSASSWNMTGMPSRVCSMTQRWIALTSSTVSRGVRRFPPRSTPSLGRVIWPMPCWSTDPAFAGSNAPFASTSCRFCCQTASVCATFSSSVMRDSRSATRRSIGSEASLYAGGCCAIRSVPDDAHQRGGRHHACNRTSGAGASFIAESSRLARQSRCPD